MTREEMIAAVEQEVHRLEQIRGLLASSHSERFTLPEAEPSIAIDAPKRVMSQDARRKIALAQKRRWAKQKKVAAATLEAK